MLFQVRPVGGSDPSRRIFQKSCECSVLDFQAGRFYTNTQNSGFSLKMGRHWSSPRSNAPQGLRRRGPWLPGSDPQSSPLPTVLAGPVPHFHRLASGLQPGLAIESHVRSGKCWRTPYHCFIKDSREGSL